MDPREPLDQAAFARVWSRVDARGTGPVAAVAENRPEESAAALRALAETFWADAGLYRALARRSRRSGGALAALARDKTGQARRLAAAYFLRTGLRCLPGPSPAPRGPLPAVLRERFAAEGALQGRLNALAETAPAERELFAELARRAGQAAERLRAVVEREL